MGLYDRDYMRSNEWNSSGRRPKFRIFPLTLWTITILLTIYFFVDMYKTHTIRVHNFAVIAFASYSLISVIFIILAIWKPFRSYLKHSITVISIAFLGVLVTVNVLPENINSNLWNPTTYKETRKQEERVIVKEYYKDYSKFDTEELDPEKNDWHNLIVASRYLMKWKSTNISRAQKVTANELFKHTWKYVGKLVYLTIKVEQPEELSPSNSVSQALNPGGPSTVILSSIDIGGAGDAIQYHYGGPFEGFESGDRVDICGYVVGKAENTNRLGGKCYNIIIVGKYIKRYPK
ncbi:MAG: hypothetical protein ACPL1I_09820 [bacterium]